MRLITALSLFTIIPMPARQLDSQTAPGAMAALPAVGLLLGGFAGMVFWAGTLFGLYWLAAVAALGVLAGLTGGLHLDGVADTADGLGSRKSADRALEIMKRSDVGPMGVIALLFVLFIQLAAILDLATHSVVLAGSAIALSAATGRAAVFFISRLPTARPGGFGALLAGTPSRLAIGLNLAALGGLFGLWGWWFGGGGGVLAGLGALGLALLVGFGWSRHLLHRLGGTTGDVYGSVIEITQSAALVGCALAAQLV